MISLHDFAFDCQASLYRQLDLTVSEISGTFYGCTGVPHPLLNGVVRCQTSNSEIEIVVEKITKHFNDLQLPYSWWVEASEEPSSLETLLEKKGFQLLGNFVVMTIDITKPLTIPKPNAKIEFITDHATFQTWGNILSTVFQISTAALSIFLKLIKKASESGKFSNVLASKDGKGVATGSVICTEDGAYICNDCTLEEEQNKGYGKAVTYKLLEIAKNQGCTRVAVISAPSESEGYQELGFINQAVLHIYTEHIPNVI